MFRFFSLEGTLEFLGSKTHKKLKSLYSTSFLTDTHKE
uniref:Uncharacterized protein n=1 Tax=Anguilla anguilla TaxID=7936 RepID=A0A0E9WGS5_ANGAN